MQPLHDPGRGARVQLLLLATFLAVATHASNNNIISRCFKVFEEPFGVLDSAELVRGRRDDCDWTIRLKGDVSVRFSLLELNITRSSNCTTDYLEVRDGLDGKVLMHVCGTELPENSTVTSRSNSLSFQLKSNDTGHNNSFRAGYSETCMSAINISGEASYDRRVYYNCSWTVYAEDPGQHIQSFIYIEDKVNKFSGRESYVDVWDGIDSTGQHLVRLHAGEWPSSGIQGQAAAMHFSLVTFMKFWIVHAVIHTSYTTRNNMSCGERLAVDWTTDGQLNSSQHNRLPDCVWNITHFVTGAGYIPAPFVQFSLLELNITRTSNCTTDYLEVRDGLDGNVLMHVCGTELPENDTVTSQGESLSVQLKSSGSGHNNSFRARYTKACGAVITVGIGGLLRLRPNCSWTLVAQKQSQYIRLKGKYFYDLRGRNKSQQIEGSADVWDGYDDTGKHRMHYREKGVFPYSVTSHGPAMHISVQGSPLTWFGVSYSVQNHSCGDELHTTEYMPSAKELNSAVYNRTDNCVWLIKTSERYLVEFTLLDLAINATNCSTDYLEVIDGPTPGGKVLGRLCSQHPKRSTYISQSNAMTVRFKSSCSNHNNSFRASYKQACRADISVSRRDNVLKTGNCTWTFKPENGINRIIIDNFAFFGRNAYMNLESILLRRHGTHCETARAGSKNWGLTKRSIDSGCVNKTYVDVWEGLDGTRQLKGRFCDGHLPRRPIISQPGAALNVTLVTPAASPHDMFCMDFNALLHNSPAPTNQCDVWIIIGCITSVIATALLVYVWVNVRREQRESQTFFQTGNVDNIIPYESIIGQAKYLPYDNIFEIRKDQLRLGLCSGNVPSKQLHGRYNKAASAYHSPLENSSHGGRIVE